MKISSLCILALGETLSHPRPCRKSLLEIGAQDSPQLIYFGPESVSIIVGDDSNLELNDKLIIYLMPGGRSLWRTTRGSYLAAEGGLFDSVRGTYGDTVVEIKRVDGNVIQYLMARHFYSLLLIPFVNSVRVVELSRSAETKYFFDAIDWADAVRTPHTKPHPVFLTGFPDGLRRALPTPSKDRLQIWPWPFRLAATLALALLPYAVLKEALFSNHGLKVQQNWTGTSLPMGEFYVKDLTRSKPLELSYRNGEIHPNFWYLLIKKWGLYRGENPYHVRLTMGYSDWENSIKEEKRIYSNIAPLRNRFSQDQLKAFLNKLSLSAWNPIGEVSAEALGYLYPALKKEFESIYLDPNLLFHIAGLQINSLTPDSWKDFLDRSPPSWRQARVLRIVHWSLLATEDQRLGALLSSELEEEERYFALTELLYWDTNSDLISDQNELRYRDSFKMILSEPKRPNAAIDLKWELQVLLVKWHRLQTLVELTPISEVESFVDAMSSRKMPIGEALLMFAHKGEAERRELIHCIRYRPSKLFSERLNAVEFEDVSKHFKSYEEFRGLKDQLIRDLGFERP